MWNAIYNGRISCICGNVSYDLDSEPDVISGDHYWDTSIFWTNDSWQEPLESWLDKQTAELFGLSRSKPGVAKTVNISSSLIRRIMDRASGKDANS